MINTLLQTFLCLYILVSQHPVYAESIFDHSQKPSLYQRESDWPSWSLPGPFKVAQLQEDLIYPKTFEGEWQVISIDFNDSNKKVVKHLARFQSDSLGRVIADRGFNAKSLGKEILGDQLFDVKNDPDSPNRQVAILNNSETLETKIIGRRQEMNDNQVFFSDELALQIFHSPTLSRINRVETLTRYQSCKDSGLQLKKKQENSICGEQWQVKYKGPGESLSSEILSNNHFLLIFIPPQENFDLNQFLIDLSSQKDMPIQDYH